MIENPLYKNLYIFNRTLIYMLVIYAVYVVYYVATWDLWGSDYNWELVFVKTSPTALPDGFMTPGENEGIMVRNIEFDNGTSIELRCNSNRTDSICCWFKNRFLDDCPYSEFKEINDSIKSILEPYGFTERFYQSYSGNKFYLRATDRNLSAWFFMRDFNDALVKKPYISVLPLAILLAVFSWYRKNRTQKESDE